MLQIYQRRKDRSEFLIDGYSHIDKLDLDAILIKDVITVHFDDPRKKPIFLRRRVKSEGQSEDVLTVHMIGWQMKIGNENIQNINYVFEDADSVRIETAGKFDEKRNDMFNDLSPKFKELMGI